MSDATVLTEDEALELLAFLVTAARTQVNEPNEYAPLRLLTAARKLGDFICNRVSSDTRQLAECLWHGQTKTRFVRVS